jgi:ubiquitin-activating enzyme E1
MDPFSSPSPQELFAAINVIESFRSSNGGALPRVRNPDDAAACAAIAHPSNPEPNSLTAKVASLADIEVHGLAAFIGGVCAQEVIKVTGLGIPLLGRFVHECLPLDVASTAFVSRDDRYDDLRALLGQDVLDKLHNQRVFLVGAGALGCEYLKGFALAGVGSGPTGAVVVTDMDRIEVSNLNRQFLFRKEHVGALKSECAAASARAMNTSLNIESLSVGVGAKTEATFNDAFWTSKTLIVNALDNVPARRYVDSQCQLYKLSLLESGTEGPKANVQVILEGESATYSEGKDQETETIALCTLKEFPFAIEHTIQWAKVLIFNEEFSEAPSHARDFAQNPQDFFAKIKINASQNARLADLRKTLQFVTRARTVTLDSCVAAAVQCFTQEFDKKIEATISGKPRDAVDEKTGQPVWAPPKRFPTAIKFNHRDESHCKFVAEFAALEATVHGVPLPSDWSADSISSAFETGLFVEKHADGPLTLADGQSEADLLAALEAEALDTTFLAKLAVCVSPQEFEKDDDTNHHIAFISAAANIRAENFSIPTVDEFRVKLIAGKIIAALATTTTAVTGLVAIELLKVAAGLKVDSFKDCMFNLSDSSTNISFEPAPPQRVSCGAAAQRRAMSEIESGQVAPGDAEAAAALAKNLDRAKALEKEMGLAGGFSLWDALTPPDSAQTVGQLADWIQKEFKVRLVRLWFDTQEQDSTDPENPDEGVMPIYAKIFDELFPSLSKRDVRIADKLRSSLQELQLRHPKKGIAGVVGGRQLWRLSWECEDEDDENAVFSVPCILFKIL